MFFVSFFCVAKDNTFHLEYVIGDTNKKVDAIKYKNGILLNRNSSVVLKAATLEWPPYVSEKLCNKGWVYTFTSILFSELGYGLYIEFLPWARAVREVELGRMDILFPEYYIPESSNSQTIQGKKRLELIKLSQGFGKSDVSFVKRKGDERIVSNDFSKIKDYSLGVVIGYENEESLDKLIKKGEIRVVEASSDLNLVKLLVNEKVDFIVGDFDVFKSSIELSSESELVKSNLLEGMVAIKPSLKYHELHYAVSSSDHHNDEVFEAVNSKISELKRNGLLEDLILQSKNTCIN